MSEARVSEERERHVLKILEQKRQRIAELERALRDALPLIEWAAECQHPPHPKTTERFRAVLEKDKPRACFEHGLCGCEVCKP